MRKSMFIFYVLHRTGVTPKCYVVNDESNSRRQAHHFTEDIKRDQI